MLNNLLVSVIIPIHNSEKYIGKCVDSIINQTYTNWELLLIDDASTDKSGEICKRYAEKDQRIKYYLKDHGGSADTRNKGLDLANGDYLYFADSDDYCERDLLETIIKCIEQTHADMVVFGYYRHKNGLKSQYVYEGGEITSEKVLESLLVDSNIGNYIWNKVFAKELFNDIRFPKGEIFEDASIMYKLILKCECIVSIDKIMYHYQMRADSLSSVPKTKHLLFYWKVLEERKTVIDQIYPQEEEKTKISLIEGAIYIWNQVSRKYNTNQLVEFSFLIDYIQKNKDVIKYMPLSKKIMGYLICKMPYRYAKMIHFLKGKNNG